MKLSEPKSFRIVAMSQVMSKAVQSTGFSDIFRGNSFPNCPGNKVCCHWETFCQRLRKKNMSSPLYKGVSLFHGKILLCCYCQATTRTVGARREGITRAALGSTQGVGYGWQELMSCLSSRGFANKKWETLGYYVTKSIGENLGFVVSLFNEKPSCCVPVGCDTLYYKNKQEHIDGVGEVQRVKSLNL